MKNLTGVLIAIFLGACATTQAPQSEVLKPSDPNKIQWVSWTPDLFDRAKKENRFVVLDLEAVWCHWCHVMEEETYSNPQVISFLKEKFIAVRVDQDARPDISRRYEDWGWPATIFFAPDGTELVKRAGYIPPEKFLAVLNRVTTNPKPEEADESKKLIVADSPFLSKEIKKELENGYLSQYDKKYGGWGKVHKFLFGETEEYALRRAFSGSQPDAQRVKRALTAARALIDPVWGGVYQYSVEDWKNPHFEKIVPKQADNLLLYSQGYILFRDKSYLKAASDVYRYLNDFLRSPEGGYYTSQDADLVKGKHSESYFNANDAGRRKQGIPAIDKHRYARENGMVIAALTAYFSATGDDLVLMKAKESANWVLKNRKRDDGGFNHDEKDAAGPYLGDSLEMGWALVKLYEASGDRHWLDISKNTLHFIERNFSNTADGKPAGFVTSTNSMGASFRSEPVREENIRLARYANQLFPYTAVAQAKKVAEQAMRFVVSPDIVGEYPTGGVLLADLEFTQAPVHMTIVGSKTDPQASQLFKAALRFPTSYKRVDWWDKSEGPLPNPDVTYPELEKAAAFACSEGRCSLPSFSEKELL
ncbi:MAG: DUF255 domain-containing protein, partial [Bdellovibrionia bacterium]